jgi:DNA-binding NarL/FixJ family response regulator
MDLWSGLGALWDQAYAGEAALAASKATHLAHLTDDPVERSVLLAFVANCEMLLCHYSAATSSSLDAAIVAEGAASPAGEDARFYTGSMRMLAAAMLEPEVSGVTATLPLPSLPALQAYAATVDRDRPERLLLLHPVVEASMSSGLFAEVDELITSQRPFLPRDELYAGSAPLTIDVIWARSLAFRGRLDEMTAHCLAMLETPAVSSRPQAVMITEAMLCFAAAQRFDRKEVEFRSARVLTEARKTVNYVAVGSCMLVSWSFSAIGQVQRAAALLVSVCGGAELSRIKTWDRAFGYELLVTAALGRGDLASARQWADRAAPLASRPAAAAAVERTMSRVAVASGDLANAVLRAHVSARLDELSGARLDALRARLLYASALAASGKRELALETLERVSAEADELGATSIRTLATREWKVISASAPTSQGGFARLSGREREIAILVAEGHTNRSIGNTLFLSERTVQTHLSRILKVMGLPSRTAIPAALGVGTAAGDAPELTPRQEQIARLVAKGHANAHIAHELGISVKTVENHLAGIFARWQVTSRTAVANLFVARDLGESKKARTT